MFIIKYLALAHDCPVSILHSLFINSKRLDPNDLLCQASKVNDLYTISIAITLGANDWNRGMAWAAEGGHRELVELFQYKINNTKL